LIPEMKRAGNSTFKYAVMSWDQFNP